MLNKVDYYEQQSQALLGYALPQVWLLHANELNAVAYADLVAGVQRRGYRVVALDEAMRDPAYARGEDGWTVTTRDGKLSAQAEHTVLVTETGVDVLTMREGERIPTA